MYAIADITLTFSYKFFKASILVLILALLSCASWASPQIYHRFHHFKEAQDIKEASTTLTQDHKGMLWLGTQQGLYRYNGNSLTRFNAQTQDPDSLSDDFITRLLADNNHLWIGTRKGGLNQYDLSSGRFKHIPFAEKDTERSAHEISALYKDDNQRLWVSFYGQGLFSLDSSDTELKTFNLPTSVDGVSTRYINAIWRENADIIWLASGDAPLRSKEGNTGGLIRWNLSTQTGQAWQPDNSELASDSITSLLPFDSTQGTNINNSLDQTLLIATYGKGLWQINRKTLALKPWDAPTALQTSQVSSVVLDAQGQLWVATYGQGLWKQQVNSDHWSHIPHHADISYGIRNNNINELYIDQQQALWLVDVANFSVLNRIGQQIRTLPASSAQANMLAANNVLAFHPREADLIWIANVEGGIAQFSYNSGKVERYALPQGDDAPKMARTVYHAETLWVGTEKGLFTFDPDTQIWTPFALPEISGKPPVIRVIHQDRQKRLWVGTFGDGLFVLDQQRQLLKHFHASVDTTTPIASVMDITEDTQGSIWVGTYNAGLFRFAPRINSWQHWPGDNPETGLQGSWIFIVHEEAGHIWVRTSEGDHRWLNTTSGAAFKNYASEEHWDESYLSARAFLAIEPQIALQQQRSLMDLTHFEGSQGSYFLGADAVLTMPQHSLLLLGGPQGVDFINLTQLPNDLPLPAVQFTQFSLFNQPVDPAEGSILQNTMEYTQSIELQYEQDVFSVKFSVPGLFQSDQLQFRYRLQGFSEDWLMAASDERQATYTRLPPGQYQLEVAARLASGRWHEPSVLEISILPPWWMTWWFRSLVAASLITIISLIFVAKIRVERKIQAQLRRLVAERTQELKLKNEALEASNQDLVLLNQTGREITASLDMEQVLERCRQRLRDMIDIEVMVISLFRKDSGKLETLYWFDENQTMPESIVNPLIHACFVQQSEIQINDKIGRIEHQDPAHTSKDQDKMETLHFYPLWVNQQVVGVFSIQSTKKQAFSNSQIHLLRTLCSNLAIALMNADTVSNLKQTQEQLMMHEKMASLGKLIAGVAHEINTPMGNCIMATSRLKQEFNDINQVVQSKTLKQSHLNQYLRTTEEGLNILDINTQRVNTLIGSFKEVSTDRAESEIRTVVLPEYIEKLKLTMLMALESAQCDLQIDCVMPISWETDANAFARILTHLIFNSVQHAFEKTANPTINISLSEEQEHIQLEFSDNGSGLDEHTLQNLFEPFFTTKRFHGHSGLGAHIIYNLVTGRFKGQITVTSGAGESLRYLIRFPKHALESLTTD